MANNHASSLFLFSLRYKSDVMPYIFMIVSNNVDSDKLICTLYTFDGFQIKLSNLIVYSRLRSMWDITALTIGSSLKLVLATNHTSLFSTSLIALYPSPYRYIPQRYGPGSLDLRCQTGCLYQHQQRPSPWRYLPLPILLKLDITRCFITIYFLPLE